MNHDNYLISILTEIDELMKSGRQSEAVWMIKRYTTEFLSTLGIISFLTSRDVQKSEEYFQIANKIKEANWRAYTNFSFIYQESLNWGKAKETIEKAIKYCEDESDIPYYNAGVVYAHFDDEMSIKMYRKALEINPDNLQAQYNLGVLLLKHGYYEEGWKLCETRFVIDKLNQETRDHFDCPYWNGESLEGKTLCVFNEQGIGDFIQFSRFLSLIPGKFVVVAQESLRDLFPEVIGRLDLIPKYDYCVSIISLPYILKLNKESDLSICKKSDIVRNKKIRVGLCWAGNPKFAKDYLRSIQIKNLIPLMHNDANFVSLQDKDRKTRKWNGKFIDIDEGYDLFIMEKPKIDNLLLLSEAIESCDLIITVDTAVAHLAGSMGKVVWVMIPKVCDWRWGAKDKTCWYPSVKIFRQKESGDWQSVIESINQLLPIQIHSFQKEKEYLCDDRNTCLKHNQ